MFEKDTSKFTRSYDFLINERGAINNPRFVTLLIKKASRSGKVKIRSDPNIRSTSVLIVVNKTLKQDLNGIPSYELFKHEMTFS